MPSGSPMRDLVDLEHLVDRVVPARDEPDLGPVVVERDGQENVFPVCTQAAPRCTAAASIRLSVPSSSSSPQRPQLRTRSASSTNSSSSGMVVSPGEVSVSGRAAGAACGSRCRARSCRRSRRRGRATCSSNSFLRVRPRGVGVRVVGLERDVVDADRGRAISSPCAVVEEAAVDVLGSSTSTAARAPCPRRRPTPRCSSHTSSARSRMYGIQPIWPSLYASLSSREPHEARPRTGSRSSTTSRCCS